jgi:release factor glutamine methyltransferase
MKQDMPSVGSIGRSLRALLDWGTAELARFGDEARADAMMLLGAGRRVSRATILAHPEALVSSDQLEEFCRAIERRRSGEPVAYILGCQAFHAIDLHVDDSVLVPRPESELLVDAVLDRTSREADFDLLDLGTGSGALALAVKQARACARVTAVDFSEAALQVAARNGARLGLDVCWKLSNWLSAMTGERFDFIVCNPPYVASHDSHMQSLSFEPRVALDGGPDGLGSIREILSKAAHHLRPGGLLIMEHGFDQADSVAVVAGIHGLAVVGVQADLAGHPRISIMRSAR